MLHRSPLLRLLLSFVVLAAALCVLSGCAIRTPEDRARSTLDVPSQIDPSKWPARHPELITEYLASRQINPQPAPEVPHPVCTPDDLESLRENVNRIACLRRLTLHGGDYVPRGSFGEGVVLETLDSNTDSIARFCVLLNRLEEPHLHRALASPEPRRVGSEGIDRFHFVLKRTDVRPRRGLAIHVVSIGDLSYEERVIDELRADGWDTLTCIPRGFTVSVLTGFDDEGNVVGPREVIEPERLAASLDNYIASTACATEAMLLHLDYRYPERREQPIALCGFSLGSLASPTIAARLGDRVKAVVLVGGGANVARILLTGSLTGNMRDTVRRETGSAGVARLRTLPDEYLAASRFDPYHTARHLVDTPVLLLHASFDAIVPASTGDLLYDRLGRPERWSYPLGHLGLFWLLPTQKERIARWLARATREPGRITHGE